MRIGDLVYVSFKGKKPVAVKISGFPSPGKATVTFMFNSSRHITIDTSRIKTTKE